MLIDDVPAAGVTQHRIRCGNGSQQQPLRKSVFDFSFM